ncbi:MAG TPA: AMP-binding protein [Kofleriaceae bacterium]|nr:AMP-binding protein [Kofleriaceae bacterium]
MKLAAPDIERLPRPGGGFVLRSRRPAPARARCLGDLLVRWAAEAPDRTLFAERDATGAWRHVSYRDALDATRALAEALLALGLGPRRPLLVLSGNSIAHALLALAAMHVGVAIAPVSPAYSQLSTDHVKLRAMAALLAPGAIFVEQREPFARALAALAPGVPVLDATDVERLRATRVTSAVDDAFAAVDDDTIAKLLFTSGSTGTPKAVINTQRMLCSNQAALAAGWPFLDARPPVIVDWLPWSHTFGANHNFNLVLAHGGTLYIDGGKPAPGLFDTTLANLRDVASTIYFNVPRGFDLLVGHLETDAPLRARFFEQLDVVFYAAAALSPATWDRLARVAELAGARDLAMTSAWGSTETSPLVTQVCFPIERAGVIGVPVPGVELAFVPSGDKLEMRVRGPNVSPGYLREGGAIEPLPLDDAGFYPMGDAGRLADDTNPNAGVVFEGRTSENFKLSSGTWVHVGELRVALIAACAPLVADAVIAGHDRDEVGALVFLAPGGRDDANVRDALRAALARHAAGSVSSSTHVARLLVLAEPPSIDAGEITDKGYLNQRAILDRRAAEVTRLFRDDDPDILRPS